MEFVLELEEEERLKSKEKLDPDKPGAQQDLDALTCPLCYTFPRKSAKHLPCCNRMICSTCLKDFFQSNASQMLPSVSEIDKILKKRQSQLKKETSVGGSASTSNSQVKEVVVDVDDKKSSEEEDAIGPTCPFCRAQLIFYPGLIRAAGSSASQSSQSASHISLDVTPQEDQQYGVMYLSKILKKSQRVIIDLPNAEVQKVLVGLDVVCPYGKNSACTWIGRRDDLYNHLTKDCVVCVDPITSELSVPLSDLKKYSLEDDEISLRERRDSPLLHSFLVPPYLLRALENVRPTLQITESSNVTRVQQPAVRHVRLLIVVAVILVIAALFAASMLGKL